MTSSVVQQDLVPTINGIEVQLGDIVSGPERAWFTVGQVRGWSPCGGWLYVSWLGVVPIAKARWVTDPALAVFPNCYAASTQNEWAVKVISFQPSTLANQS